MSSQKVPINPILDERFKNLVKNQSDANDVSQSDLVSKLIDAAQISTNDDSTEEEEGKNDSFYKLLGFAATDYILGETESKVRRFYVRGSQREWLKKQGGVSDALRAVLALYIFGELDPYLPPEFRLWSGEKSWTFHQIADDMSEELEDKMSDEDD
mgnify:CR=1 FL=1